MLAEMHRPGPAGIRLSELVMQNQKMDTHLRLRVQNRVAHGIVGFCFS